MASLDPEVRADVEHAARILAREAACSMAGEEGGEGGDDWEEAEADSGAASGQERPGPMAAADGGELGALPARPQQQCHPQHASLAVGVDEFVALMEEALQRTRGLARAYLSALPASAAGRRKWEEPTFRPAVDPRSLVSHLESSVVMPGPVVSPQLAACFMHDEARGCLLRRACASAR
jgi:hypothetical protein